MSGDPLEKPETPAMKAALDALGKRKGAPAEADAPPLSTFPLPPAAKAALEMSGAKRRRKR